MLCFVTGSATLMCGKSQTCRQRFFSAEVSDLILCGLRPLVTSQSLPASQRLAAHQSGRANEANSMLLAYPGSPASFGSGTPEACVPK